MVTTLRVWLSGGAAALAVIAVVVSAVDNATEALAFFVVAAAVAGLQTWAVRVPFSGSRRNLSIGIAIVWLIASAWIGALASSRPLLPPEATYLGLTATTYHLVALYGGAVLVALSAFLRNDGQSAASKPRSDPAICRRPWRRCDVELSGRYSPPCISAWTSF